MRTWAVCLAAMAAAACAGAASLDPLALDDATFEHEIERRFQYGPPAPAPTETADQRVGQIADAVYFASFPDYDRSYSPTARSQARQLAAQLRAEAGSLTHEQFVLGIAEIAALADNAHTSIGENAFRKNTPRLPIRTYLFSDGLHVLYANDANADLLGARIEAIDGRSIDDIYAIIRRYRGGPEAFRRLQLTPMLESPALLEAAGAARARDALTLTGLLANGQPFSRRIDAERRDRSAWVSSTARLVFPDQFRRHGMQSFLRASESGPPSLRASDHLFWMEPLGDGLYVRLDHNGDADEGPIGVFLDSVLTRTRADRPAFIVLDMRLNTGGDYTKTYGFARALPSAASGAPIYVLTSGWTFSAAITTVAALEDEGGEQVTIVGEPVGDRLDFWAEGGSFELPNAFLLVHYAAGRHVYNGPCTDLDDCFWLNYRYPVRVHTLDPDIRAPLTFAVYRNGRDPALEAVLARESSRGATASRR